MEPRLTDDHLEIRFTPLERVLGLLRDARVPLSAVRSVEVVPDGMGAVRGLRAPGLAVPGLRRLGTWRAREGKTLVAVRRGQAAVRIGLEGERWSELLLGTHDAVGLAATVRAAAPAPR
jgi:hypothetical protein